MNGEFLGLGRTWWAFVLILIATTILLATGKVDAAFWREVVTWAFGIAGGKSALCGAAKAIKVNK